ncbi:uncharacterized protein [Phaseolus vulgaris]|uniref:uncharacterized protein n=1 Tax=Phaseolus vulgaris TaxID=3885 RepID=UPI0035CB44D5
MIDWSVELSEFDIHYQPRGAIKSQCLADFSAELTPLPTLSGGWTLYVDGSSNKTACGAGVVLEGLDDPLLEQALQFGFRATNNQAEYEALLAGLKLAYNMGAREVVCKNDSQFMVSQIKGEFEVKEPLLQCYYHAAQNSIARFNKAPLEHIPREDNKRANILFKLSVTKKKSHQRSVIQIWLRHPSVSETECPAIDEVEAETDNWMTPIIQYIKNDTCKPEQEKAMKQQCARYTMINEDLYQRGYSTLLLKCITSKRAEYILAEIHEGICGNHYGRYGPVGRLLSVDCPG